MRLERGIRKGERKKAAWSRPLSQSHPPVLLIALVGALRYQQHQSLTELYHSLRERGLSIGERTVLNLPTRSGGAAIPEKNAVLEKMLDSGKGRNYNLWCREMCEASPIKTLSRCSSGVEQRLRKPRAGGSNPFTGFYYCSEGNTSSQLLLLISHNPPPSERPSPDCFQLALYEATPGYFLPLLLVQDRHFP